MTRKPSRTHQKWIAAGARGNRLSSFKLGRLRKKGHLGLINPSKLRTTAVGRALLTGGESAAAKVRAEKVAMTAGTTAVRTPKIPKAPAQKRRALRELRKAARAAVSSVIDRVRKITPPKLTISPAAGAIPPGEMKIRMAAFGRGSVKGKKVMHETMKGRISRTSTGGHPGTTSINMKAIRL